MNSNEFNMQRSAPKRIRSCIRRVYVARLLSTWRGRVPPACWARPPHTQQNNGSGTTRTNTKSAQEAPGSQEAKPPPRAHIVGPSGNSAPGTAATCNPPPKGAHRPSGRRGNRRHAKASNALVRAHAWETSVHEGAQKPTVRSRTKQQSPRPHSLSQAWPWDALGQGENTAATNEPMQHDSAQQHATLTRGPPRNALVRLACCFATAC